MTVVFECPSMFSINSSNFTGIHHKHYCDVRPSFQSFQSNISDLHLEMVQNVNLNESSVKKLFVYSFCSLNITKSDVIFIHIDNESNDNATCNRMQSSWDSFTAMFAKSLQFYGPININQSVLPVLVSIDIHISVN